MFTATGVSVRRNRDQTITVRVQIVDDRSGRPIEIKEFTGMGVQAVQAAVQEDLRTRQQKEVDTVLESAIVGQVLGEV